MAESLVGPVPGGLAMVTVVVSLFFSAISGSGAAATAAVGGLLIPAMVAAGYSRPFAAGLTAAGGGIGIIIPPSLALIVYGVVAQVSIGRLFIAGILPGVVVRGSLMVVSYLVAKRRGYQAVAATWSGKRVVKAFREALWGLLAPVIILGGIYGEVFTPTEAAAVGVLYGLVVGVFVYRDLSAKVIWRILRESAVTTAAIMFIVAAASVFSYVLTVGGLVFGIADTLARLTGSRVALLLFVNLVLLIAGMFMDGVSVFYIFVPIFAPAVAQLGVDPVHFGIIATVNVAIGQITPPVGVNLFVAAPIARLNLPEVSAAIFPFLVAELVALAVIVFVPELSLWLPGLISP